MYIYIYRCIFMHIYIYSYIHIFIYHFHLYMYAYIHFFIFTYIHIYIHFHIYILIHIYIYIYLHILQILHIVHIIHIRHVKHVIHIIHVKRIIEGSFRSQTSDNMDRWKKQSRAETERRERLEESRVEESQKKEGADARKGRKVAIHCVFPMICGSGGSKSMLAKAAGAEPAGQMRDEKLHAVLARSRFWSEKVQNTWVSEHFWKLRCRKSARRCGAKHISKWKCTKHTILGPLLESCDVEKVHTVVTRSSEAHFEVKMYKTPQPRTTFGSWDVEKVHAVVAPSTFRSEHGQNTTCSRHFWRFRCCFASLHYITLRYTTLHYTALHYTTLHYTTLQL